MTGAAPPDLRAGTDATTDGPADPWSVVIAAAARRLAAAGIEDGLGDARHLARLALGVDRIGLVGLRDSVPDAAGRAAFEALVARRAAREPVSRIAGRREFWSLDLALTPDTLDPRPDSETAVAALLDRLPAATEGRVPRVVDLGTGSGCLLLAVLAERPDAAGLGVDRSAGAVAAARSNAARVGLADRAAFAVADWAAALGGPVDAIIANPPYIRRGDLADLAPEVTGHDPRAALDGGPDGLDAYRALLPDAVAALAPGGVLALEIGHDQAGDVTALAAGAGLVGLETRADLAGRPRCIAGEKPFGDSMRSE
ncbi:MAG: peptide chain release factor N(5)-glutamine methyltransferase [Azospirillaceae bacterium]